MYVCNYNTITNYILIIYENNLNNSIFERIRIA